METLKPILKNLISNSVSRNKVFMMNLAKEYLQIIVLDFIYANPKYSKMFFYGGSCLAQCFGLNRLSEDLDFVDSESNINIGDLSRDIEEYFLKNTDLELKTSTQKFRIYLKFPILAELGISGGDPSETDFLILKVEVFSGFNFCKKYNTEIRPIFKFNKSVLIKTFDLPTLMSTKIRAILNRKWEKRDKLNNIIIKVKGRDYFDLLWYLEKGVIPNLECIENIKDVTELKNKLLETISNIDSQSIRLDLEAFIDNENFINNISANLKDILAREIKEKL
ncbi:MAG: nucleotidyl transferase AbiEii/AbiGii toxin family protein [Candidatus Paceibacterota bacterium]|jgi:predicted nucleotidyltransferase component of viral defense system